jgi:hypothetical protein
MGKPNFNESLQIERVKTQLFNMIRSGYDDELLKVFEKKIHNDLSDEAALMISQYINGDIDKPTISNKDTDEVNRLLQSIGIKIILDDGDYDAYRSPREFHDVKDGEKPIYGFFEEDENRHLQSIANGSRPTDRYILDKDSSKRLLKYWQEIVSTDGYKGIPTDLFFSYEVQTLDCELEAKHTGLTLVYRVIILNEYIGIVDSLNDPETVQPVTIGAVKFKVMDNISDEGSVIYPIQLFKDDQTIRFGTKFGYINVDSYLRDLHVKLDQKWFDSAVYRVEDILNVWYTMQMLQKDPVMKQLFDNPKPMLHSGPASKHNKKQVKKYIKYHLITDEGILKLVPDYLEDEFEK